MSTLRTTNVIHGSSAVSNIVLDNQGRAIFGPDGPNGRASLYVNAQTNRVGVNTETPSVALDVDGAINTTGNVAIGGTLDVTGNIGFTGLVTGINASFTGNVNIDGNLTVDTNTLFVDSANNRVGVGTTSPTSIFHIQGSNPVLTMRDSDTLGDNISSYILFEDSSGNDRAYIGRAGSSDLRVFGNGDTVFATGGIATSDESMRLDSSGRLLIGTSTALSSSVNNKFQIAAASSSGVSTIQDIFSFNTGGGVAALTLNRSNSTTLGTNTLVTSGQTLGIINFNGADGTNYIRGATIACVVDGTAGTNDMPGRLVFSTTADGDASVTERMRIDSNGSIFNRTGGASWYVNLPNDITYYRALSSGSLNGYNQHIWFKRSTGTSERGMKFNTYDNVGNEQVWVEWGGNVGIRFPGTVTTTASAANAVIDTGNSNQLLVSTSSLRYKTNIENIEETYSNNVLKLQPIWYRSTAEHDRSDWSWYGLVAEEVAKIEPRLVNYGYTEDAYEKVQNEDGTFSDQLKSNAQAVPDGVQYERLSVLLLDVVKRQQKAIESLENRIAALENT